MLCRQRRAWYRYDLLGHCCPLDMTRYEKQEMAERKAANYRRRVRLILDGLGLKRWDKRRMHQFVWTRLMQVQGDTINDPDLKVLVRIYNRERL